VYYGGVDFLEMMEVRVSVKRVDVSKRSFVERV